MCVCVCVFVHYVLYSIYCIRTQGLEEGPDQYSGGDVNKTFVQLLIGHILRYIDYCLF